VPLIETHLGEAVSQLKAYGISAKLCWNNAAVYIDYALRLTAEGRAFEGSDLPFFTESCLPGGGVNPFRGCLQHVEEDGERVARRKVCCLRYMLPGIPSCGKLCALPAQRSQ
jgi:ferric iron reductase protein FhuF